MSLDVVPHIILPFVSSFPAVSTRIVAILSPHNVLANLLINLLNVIDSRIIGDHHGS